MGGTPSTLHPAAPSLQTRERSHGSDAGSPDVPPSVPATRSVLLVGDGSRSAFRSETAGTLLCRQKRAAVGNHEDLGSERSSHCA